jgi:MscS family membrane protein
MSHKNSLLIPVSILLSLFLVSLPLVVTATEQEKPTFKDVLEKDESAQSSVPITPTVKKVIALPPDKFNRQTPRSSINGFAAAMEESNYELAMEYMDTRYIPQDVSAKGSELARELKIIAKRAIWVSEDIFSDDPEGHSEDGLPAYRDLITVLNTPQGPINIYMQRVPGDEPGTYIWKLSNQTVAQIPTLYAHYGYGPIGDYLSQIIPDKTLFVFELWQWLLLFVIFSVAYAISWIMTGLVVLILRRQKTLRSERQQKFLKGPLRFLLMVILARSNFDLLSPSLEAQAIIDLQTLVIVAITWLMIGVVNLVIGRLSDRMLKAGNENATVLLRPAKTALKIIVISIAALHWFQNMGYNISTLLAGLGIGSVAIALAAQKSIENLIGSITLYAAQPIRIGDLCKYGDTFGVVEEIGLRSTKIRTLDRTVKHIPNARLSSLEIENYVERDMSLFKPTLRLRIDTTPDQIRYILVKAREMMYAHPMVDQGPARIRFLNFDESSLNLEVFAYIKTTDFNEYFEVCEDLNLRFMDIIEEAGTSLAIPARMNYVDDQGRPKNELSKTEAEDKVQEWKEKGEYYIPKFSDKRKDELKETLDYPQKGSPFSKEEA